MYTFTSLIPFLWSAHPAISNVFPSTIALLPGISRLLLAINSCLETFTVLVITCELPSLAIISTFKVLFPFDILLISNFASNPELAPSLYPG